jgi:hypothetical protein
VRRDDMRRGHSPELRKQSDVVNKKFLTSNIGKSLQLRPPAQHVDVAGRTAARDDDTWCIDAYEDGILRLRNVATGASGVLAHDSVHSYRSDADRGDEFGYLILLAQTYVRGPTVSFVPVTRPGEALPIIPNILLAEAYLQTSMECHLWKSAFLNIHGWDLPTSAGHMVLDVWDAMEENWPPKYSDGEFARYQPLFVEQLRVLLGRLDRVMQLFHHVLPHDYQADIVRACRQLEVEHWTYQYLPALLRQVGGVGADEVFRARFSEVGRLLRQLSRDADQRRDVLRDALAI